MNVKTYTLCLLIAASYIQPSTNAMQREYASRASKAVRAAVGIGACIAFIYALPRILSFIESDKFIETNNARLYKKPNTSKYALLAVCEQEVILCEIKVRPLIGICTETMTIKVNSFFTAQNAVTLLEKSYLREMQLVRALPNDSRVRTINLAHRSLQQIIEEYEAGAPAIVA